MKHFTIQNMTFLFGIALLLVQCQTKSNKHQQQTQQANGALPQLQRIQKPIKPPLKGVKVKPEIVTVEPGKKQIAEFKGGIKVEIPANAFVDAQGNVVTKPVKLALEVYDTPAKILASGIPMTYDNGKTKGDFESAGMFQLTGTSQGQKVSIAPNKQLRLNYPSKVKGDDFDFFYFEEEAGKKNEENTVAMAQIGGRASTSTATRLRKGYWKKLTKTAPKPTRVKPQKEKPQEKKPKEAKKDVPQKLRKGIDSFQLKFKKDSFPALTDLEKVQWQLATNFKNPKAAQHRWVLNEQWSALELTQPKLITTEPVYQKNLQGSMLMQYFRVFPDKKHWVIVSDSKVTVHNNKGKVISKLSTGLIKSSNNIQLYGNKYILLKKENRYYLYNLRGKQIGSYGQTVYGGINLWIKQNRVLVREMTKVRDTIMNVHLMDLSGRKIKTFKLGLKPYSPISHFDDINVGIETKITGEKYVVTNDVDGIKVYDLNGKLIASKSGKYQWVEHYENTPIFALEFSGRVLAWDFIKQQDWHSPAKAFNLNPTKKGKRIYGTGSIERVPNSSVLLINESASNDDAYWNYQTNQMLPIRFYTTLSTIDNEVYGGNQDSRPAILSGYNFAEKALFIYDFKGQKLVTKLANYKGYYGEIPFHPLAKSTKLNRMLVNGESHIQMLDLQGNVIRDFKKYDPTTRFIAFTNDSQIYSVNDAGVYRKWNAQGKLLITKTLQDGKLSQFWHSHIGLGAYHNILQDRKIYDFEGNLLLHAGRKPRSYFSGSSMGLYSSFGIGQFVYLLPEIPCPEQVYQLTLRTAKKEFITYVYLNDPKLLKQTKEALKKYERFQKRKITEEVKRQKRQGQLIRSFSLKKFGIYNWDKLLKQEGRILFAASFDFKQSTDYNNITVFLITQLRGPSVITYYGPGLEKFAIDRTLPNRLVAVWPNNKLAVFSQADIDKVDWQKVKATKKYQFKMRVVEDSIENLEALTKAIQ